MRRIFGRRRRVQPQGETEYTPSGAIQALLSTLRLYEREGYLQADEVRPVIENLINNGTEGEAEFRQQASTLIDRGTERLDNRINRENQAGETKRQSRYVLQQQPQEAQEPRHVIQRRGHIDADTVARMRAGETKQAHFDVIDARNSSAVKLIPNPDGTYSIGFRGQELQRVRGPTLGTTILNITAQQQGVPLLQPVQNNPLFQRRQQRQQSEM